MNENRGLSLPVALAAVVASVLASIFAVWLLSLATGMSFQPATVGGISAGISAAMIWQARRRATLRGPGEAGSDCA